MSQKIIVDWKGLPQIRINPLTGKSVIISAKRKAKGAALNVCPFCPGNEELTTEELVRIPNPNDPQKWLTRGFSNLFPFLMIEEGQPETDGGFFQKYIQPGIGAHEIIVESPKHDACLSCLSEYEIAAIFWAMAERYFDLKKDSRFRYFYAFKNYGPGASQDHPHWQLEARVFAPHLIYEIHKAMGEYKLKNRECLLCRFWKEEKAAGRIVLETENFIAYVPLAPSEPYEVMMVPKNHTPSFAYYLQNKDLALEFASVIKKIMIKAKRALQGDKWRDPLDPHHLFCLYTSPYDEDKTDGYYHWYLDFLPRTTQKVGHERGTGEDVIPVFPEEAAKTLRNMDEQ